METWKLGFLTLASKKPPEHPSKQLQHHHPHTALWLQVLHWQASLTFSSETFAILFGVQKLLIAAFNSELCWYVCEYKLGARPVLLVPLSTFISAVRHVIIEQKKLP